ncbi:hypothetical protein GOBAR_AA05069 [Gossypium barbadense]|uniref:Uncharacterized protein n=1 Tax=Gossypium barbadense TaxID=3634 RepID=A0A2P5YIU1_GOSBA|nr:hypothetical protein GOBAR_AA05069 [Gossypium barbadense]
MDERLTPQLLQIHRIPSPPLLLKKALLIANQARNIMSRLVPISPHQQQHRHLNLNFFNKCWFFDQVLNDFLVRSFLRFGYEVSFKALDKGAIEILGPYECVITRGRLPGGGGSSVVGKRETRLYEPKERLHSSSKGIKARAFCSASRNASE